jgi:hypothetical protein
LSSALYLILCCEPSEVQEHRIYTALLALSPTLEERLCTGSEQELYHIADMVRRLQLLRTGNSIFTGIQITKGASNARSDDTKSLKSVIIDWITPPNGVLLPPLQRNIKTDRGFYHQRTGELLCPVNLDWSDPKYGTSSSVKAGQLT